MHIHALACLLAIPCLVQAHFQLQFPPPRGPFVENQEPTFCDGYSTATDNRTRFPLDGGFFTFNSEHPSWTLGVLLSNSSNPTSFGDFVQVVPFFKDDGEGTFCIPLNFNANGTNAVDGQNVTVQIVFDGGDGLLYQCADLTLSNNATIPSSGTCSNATSQGNGAGGNSTGSGESSGVQFMTASLNVLLTLTASAIAGLMGAFFV
ncbi:hypothetical protein AX16_005579 [Volvariella volvacea WC 439]|nr:hypothetical protein AX16_005579 [Volvariella volvacea WC 439]